MERFEVLECSVFSFGVFFVRYVFFDYVFEFFDIDFALYYDYRGVFVVR